MFSVLNTYVWILTLMNLLESCLLSWFSRLRHIVPKAVLVLAYVENIHRLQNRAARIICANFDIIKTRGIDIVKHLN